MKGIVLAGGSGSRLHPLTYSVSKQLLPVYDKPMIYYPISVLMLAGIKEILIITTPEDQAAFKRLLKDGSQWGVRFEYVVQPRPDGLGQAFILGEDFIGDDSVCLILGDNIFYGHQLSGILQSSAKLTDGAIVFGYYVKDPERYGVVNFDKSGKALDIQEKPTTPLSNYAVTGLYFYDNHVIDIAKKMKPSARGELEITDINRHYLSKGKLQVNLLKRGNVWLDTGTHDFLVEATNYIKAVESRQGQKIGCPEEVSWRMGFIGDDHLKSLSQDLIKSDYGRYLSALHQEGK